MFWDEPWDPEAASDACFAKWGVTPRRLWASTEWGGKKIGEYVSTDLTSQMCSTDSFARKQRSCFGICESCSLYKT